MKSINFFEETAGIENDLYYFGSPEARARFFDNELRKSLGCGNRRFICWDEETQAKLADYAEIIADNIFMDDVRHAERGMSAVAMGFDPYDVIDDSGQYSHGMNKAINRAYHAHIMRYVAPVVWDDNDLPF